MAAADLVICRCGAMTLSELPGGGKALHPDPFPQCGGKSSVPLTPWRWFAVGPGVCMQEKELSSDALWDAVQKIVFSPSALREMGENAQKTAILDADERIYRVVEQTLQTASAKK